LRKTIGILYLCYDGTGVPMVKTEVKGDLRSPAMVDKFGRWEGAEDHCGSAAEISGKPGVTR